MAMYDIYHYLRLHLVRPFVSCFASTNVDEILTHKRILILSPHPDDEVFGCGGLIAHCIANGNQPKVVILSGGGASLGYDRPDKDHIVAERMKLTDRATQILGLPSSCLTRLFLEDSCMTKEFANEGKLSAVIEKLHNVEPAPDIILVPSFLDDFPDHRATRQLGIELQKSYQAHGHHSELWNYCAWIWFFHPFKLAFKSSNCLTLKMNKKEHEAKNQAIDVYVTPDAATRVCWSGDLDPLFVSAHQWNQEIYYKD